MKGVVTKDILLFRNEDASKVFYTNLVAMSMMPVWGFMGYTSYSLKSKMEGFKEDVADNTKINFLLDDVLNTSRRMGLAFFLCGAGLSSYRVVRTMTTVRRLVFRKGGRSRTCLWYTVVVFSTRSMASTGSC